MSPHFPLAAQVLLTTALTTFLTTFASAQPDRSPLGQVPLEALRLTSLYCVHLVGRSTPDIRTTKACAAVGDALVQRGFGGNVDEWLRWQRTAPAITFAAANPMAWKTLALARTAPGPGAMAKRPASQMQPTVQAQR